MVTHASMHAWRTALVISTWLVGLIVCRQRRLNITNSTPSSKYHELRSASSTSAFVICRWLVGLIVCRQRQVGFVIFRWQGRVRDVLRSSTYYQDDAFSHMYLPSGVRGNRWLIQFVTWARRNRALDAWSSAWYILAEFVLYRRLI